MMVERETSVMEYEDEKKVQEILKKINLFRKLMHKALTQGVDYGIIPGTNKPTLLKPGAEKIQRILEVTTEFEIIEEIEDCEREFFAYKMKCTVYRNGNKMTDGFGSCNTREKKYRNQDAYTISNTCLKMAKKRALVDAIISFGSLSDVFTQDMEDIDINGAPIQNSAAKITTDASGLITENQAKRMFALSKGQHQIVSEEIKKFGYLKSSEVMKINYDKICESIVARTNKEEETKNGNNKC